MKERDWRIIIDNIKTGNCVLVLGPDVATDKTREGSHPITEILSNQFADEIEKERECIHIFLGNMHDSDH